MTNKPRVLIVDDAPTVREQIRACLDGDFHCILATNGVEALRLAAEHKPAAIVSDIEMPEMGGVELLTRLKSTPTTASIPVIVCTTVTSVDSVNECRAKGCAGYVLKPVNCEYLRAKLRQVIQQAL